jgi:signal transduction histidine kinase
MSQPARLPVSGDVFFRLDSEDRLLDLSGGDPSLSLVLESLRGRSPGELLPSPLRERVQAAIAEVRSSGRMRSLSHQLPAGEAIREFEGRIVPASAGELVIWVSDVSEARYELRQLKASETRTGALLSALPDLILTLSARLIVLDYHGPAQEFLDAAPLRLLGADLRDLLPEAATRRLAESVPRVIASTRIEALEYELAREGRYLAYELRVAPLGEDRVVALLRNVTQRREAERSLLRHRDDLQRLATELTVTEERNRRDLALELHDGIGQDLAVARLMLERSHSLSGEARERELDSLLETLKRAIRRTQSLTYDLSPPTLHELGLRPALRSLLRRLAQEYGFEGQWEETGESREPDEASRVLLYRSTRELLMNVVKHAEAARVRLLFTAGDASLRVTVEDDGHGFDPALLEGPAPEGGRFGLFSVRERLAALGGRLWAESRPGLTRIELELPILDPRPAAGERVE